MKTLKSHIYSYLTIGLLVLIAGSILFFWPLPRTPISSPQIPIANRYWIISAKALNEISADPRAVSKLSHDTLLVPGTKKIKLSQATQHLRIIPVASFTSEAQLANSVRDHALPASIKAILYDNEDWTLTPQREQANPLKYYKLAASIAHANGYPLIATPVSKQYPNLTSLIARYVDVIDIQSQYNQSMAASYSGHVLPLAQAARNANPKLIILSGLSTNPPAGIPTVGQLTADARSVEPLIQGFWLNIPSPSTGCPNCRQPQPELAIQFLDNL